ncbi:hypothetical protein LZ30DRAFT_725925 [Colletotrichum cereale]|nr:hypothetical protein LZ30DRAFT_725925 [Colletotrichum cereale]
MPTGSLSQGDGDNSHWIIRRMNQDPELGPPLRCARMMEMPVALWSAPGWRGQYPHALFPPSRSPVWSPRLSEGRERMEPGVGLRETWSANAGLTGSRACSGHVPHGMSLSFRALRTRSVERDIEFVCVGAATRARWRQTGPGHGWGEAVERVRITSLTSCTE